MARIASDVNVFNLSFLDVLSCGLGAVVTLLLLARSMDSETRSVRLELDQADRKIQLSRTATDTARARAEELQQAYRELQGAVDVEHELLDHVKKQIDQLRGITFVGIQTNRTNIVLLLDLSSSVEPYREILKHSARYLVELLRFDDEARHRLAVLTFQDDEPPHFQQWQPGTGAFADLDTSRSLAFAEATPEHKQQATRAIDTIGDFVGGSPLLTAFERLAGMLDSDAVRQETAIILVSDGDSNETRTAAMRLGEVRQRIHDQLPCVEIRCLGIGDRIYEKQGTDEGPIDFLKQLARPPVKGFSCL